MKVAMWMLKLVLRPAFFFRHQYDHSPNGEALSHGTAVAPQEELGLL